MPGGMKTTIKFFPCPHCTISFTDCYFLENYIKTKHQKQYLAMLKSHVSKSQTVHALTNSCSHCTLLKYWKNLHKIAVFRIDGHISCADCGKSFENCWGLGLHRRIHTREKPYECKECGKCFSENSSYRYHLSIHSGLKLFKCQDCGKAFKQKSLLWTHLSVHTGERKFSCSQCDKRHMRTHTHLDMKQYSCQECGKSFYEQSHIKFHMKTHTGERPYPCPHCLFSFTRKAHLSKHLPRCLK
ncbi:unnamed protein product [Coregonus sp. 'balchen']|nr:unnamed protein product [Coregonus sp. 'balchen']